MPEVFTIKNQVDEARTKVELNSRQIDELTTAIINKYTAELDELLMQVKECITGVNDITEFEFETIALKIPTFLYWTSGGLEMVGVRNDLAKMFEKEKYNKIYSSVQGTIKERESVADLEARAENVVTIATNRAYKVLQSKIQAAYELLAVVKKILTRRIEERKIPEI